MAIVLYGIPNCDTVRRARAWLAEHGHESRFHDFKKAGVPPEALDRWIAALGWERLLNRQGTTWRRLGDDARAAVTDASAARALMLAHPSALRRPVIDWGTDVTVGFDPGGWPR